MMRFDEKQKRRVYENNVFKIHWNSHRKTVDCYRRSCRTVNNTLLHNVLKFCFDNNETLELAFGGVPSSRCVTFTEFRNRIPAVRRNGRLRKTSNSTLVVISVYYGFVVIAIVKSNFHKQVFIKQRTVRREKKKNLQNHENWWIFHVQNLISVVPRTLVAYLWHFSFFLSSRLLQNKYAKVVINNNKN